MARLTVIADDLTGALDTGVQFANRCVSVRVAAVNVAAVPEEIFHADVAVIDAEVRHKTSQQRCCRPEGGVGDGRVEGIRALRR